MKWRAPAAAILITAAAVALARSPLFERLDGLSIDGLLGLAHRSFGPRHPPAESRVVVIAFDEETYRREPFRAVPHELWTPQIATALSGVLAANPAVVGFDIIQSTSVDAFLPGFDRSFRLALRAGANANKILLGKVQHQTTPIAPYAGLSYAVGHDRNIRSVNLFNDPDDVIRRVPVNFLAEDGSGGLRREPSFAVELADRAGYACPPPPDESGGLLVNFDGVAAIPTYSFADIHACAEAGLGDWLARRFAGKVVLFGAVLDVEDRKITAGRWIGGGEPRSEDRCVLPPLSDLARPDFVRDSVPGVYIHAAAVNDLLRGEVLRAASPGLALGLIIALTAVVTGLMVLLPLGFGALAAGVLALGSVAAATLAFHHGVVTPMLPGLVAAGIGAILTTAYRFAVADRDKRRFRKMFGLYLAPDVVDMLAASGRMPALGGERRDLSFIFTDVAGFTSLSESTDPAVLAATLNEYLDGVCEIIMARGGLVNEFIGDAVLAIFGAPNPMPDHAARAVDAARAIDVFAEAFSAAQRARGIAFGHTRIGVHSGVATVGNLGARRRLKYAALGDVVNTASRCEGLNKYFGTRIIVSGASLADSDPAGFRPLGDFILKGRGAALAIHEALDPERAASPHIARYREAYAAMAAGEPRARDLFEALAREAPEDGCVAFHAARLRDGSVGAIVRMEEK